MAQDRNAPIRRLLLTHLIGSLAASLVVGIGVLLLDIGGIRSMAAGTSDGPLFIALLFVGLMSTFGAIGLAVGVMGLGKKSSD